MREDMRRFKKGDALVDKDELLKMAQDSEAFLLEFETEQRAAGIRTLKGKSVLALGKAHFTFIIKHLKEKST